VSIDFGVISQMHCQSFVVAEDFVAWDALGYTLIRVRWLLSTPFGSLTIVVDLFSFDRLFFDHLFLEHLLGHQALFAKLVGLGQFCVTLVANLCVPLTHRVWLQAGKGQEPVC
jgi:hypothetical protein